jgi:hypothetical protein
MTTEIVPVPALVEAAPFPTTADRSAGTYNTKAKAWADTEAEMANSLYAIGLSAHANATAAKEQAEASDSSASDSSDSAGVAATQAGAALEHANTAGTHAGTATTQAGISAEQAGIAASRAGDALTQANRAESEADRADGEANRAHDEADRAEAAAASISDGPVTSVAGATGIVLLKTINGQSLVGDSDMVIDSSLHRLARTSNVPLAAADKGRLVDITSGTFTQTFAAAATLGSGWWCYLRNSGSGDITLKPNSSETIDGAASGIVKPGMALLIQCDGVSLDAIRIDSQKLSEIKTSGTSWPCPIGVRRIKIRLAGGGSSGVFGSFGTTNAGNAGGYLEKTLSVTPGAQYVFTVGAGGDSATSGTTGLPGGDTRFTANGVTYAANGGTTGTSAQRSPGGTAINGDINVQGETSTFNSEFGANHILGKGGKTALPGEGFGSGGGIVGGAPLRTGAGAPGVLILEY